VSAMVAVFGFAPLVVGMVLMLIGSVGLVTLPDFYTRTHASSKVDTVGVMLVLLGLAVLQGVDINAVKLLVAALFVALSNPVASHAMARAARRQGLEPWTRAARSEAAAAKTRETSE